MRSCVAKLVARGAGNRLRRGRASGVSRAEAFVSDDVEMGVD